MHSTVAEALRGNSAINIGVQVDKSYKPVKAVKATSGAGDQTLGTAIWSIRILQFLCQILKNRSNEPNNGQDQASKSKCAGVVTIGIPKGLAHLWLSRRTAIARNVFGTKVPGNWGADDCKMVRSRQEFYDPNEPKDHPKYHPFLVAGSFDMFKLQSVVVRSDCAYAAHANKAV